MTLETRVADYGQDFQTKKADYKVLESKLKKLEEAYADVIAFADEKGLRFVLDGPAYGMGGSYTGKNHPRRDDSHDHEYGYPTDGWLASSQSC